MMKRPTILLALLALAVTPISAQRAGDVLGGDLPQHYNNDITNKFDLMRVDEMLADPAYLEQFYTAEQLEAFFERAVVKVSFYPDGSYVAYARQGGDIASLKLGRKKVELDGEIWDSETWRLRSGRFKTPKRPAAVTLRLSAAGNEAEVSCMNRFEPTDTTLTFYVGPMNGIRCIGLVDDEAIPFAEVLATAASRDMSAASAPGS